MKSISPGTVTIGVLAIVFGLVGVYVARRAMETPPLPIVKREPPPRVAPGPSVVYAKANLPAKTRIGWRDLAVKRLEANEEPPAGALTSTAEAIGRITKEAIRANTLLNDDSLFGVGEGPNPADLIPAGHQAVPIIVTGNQDGLIRMGSRVDVALTVTSDDLNIGKVRTQTLLHNVLVVSTGDDDFELPSPTMTTRERNRLQHQQNSQERQIIVAVPREDVNDVLAAKEFGSLSMTLCSQDGTDSAVASANPVSIIDILGIQPEPTRIPVTLEDPPAPAAPPETYKVERWIDGRLEVLEFPKSKIQEARNATAADRIRQGATVPVTIERPE